MSGRSTSELTAPLFLLALNDTALSLSPPLICFPTERERERVSKREREQEEKAGLSLSYYQLSMPDASPLQTSVGLSHSLIRRCAHTHTKLLSPHNYFKQIMYLSITLDKFQLL